MPTFSQRYAEIFPKLCRHFPNFMHSPNFTPIISQCYTDILPTLGGHFPNVTPTFSQRYADIFPTLRRHFPNVMPTFRQSSIDVLPTLLQHSAIRRPKVGNDQCKFVSILAGYWTRNRSVILPEQIIGGKFRTRLKQIQRCVNIIRKPRRKYP